MSVKAGDMRGTYKRRAVLTKKFQLAIDNRELDKRVNKPVEWTCAYCPSSSLLSVEFGCAKCQPILSKDPKAKPIGRIYK